MKLVILENPADSRYLRCQANGFRLSQKRSAIASQNNGFETEVWVKYDGDKREIEVDFGDLKEKEERN